MLGLGRRVVFHGYFAGAARTQAYATAGIMCLPSYSENFGIVAGEATFNTEDFCGFTNSRVPDFTKDSVNRLSKSQVSQ